MHEDHEPDLYDVLDEDKRKRLLARGWRQVGALLGGRQVWEPPGGGSQLGEAEAFARLAREEAAGAP